MMFETEGSRESHERQLVTRFDAREFKGGDFAGITALGGKFAMSMLGGSDFSGIARAPRRTRCALAGAADRDLPP